MTGNELRVTMAAWGLSGVQLSELLVVNQTSVYRWTKMGDRQIKAEGLARKYLIFLWRASDLPNINDLKKQLHSCWENWGLNFALSYIGGIGAGLETYHRVKG